MNDTAIQHIEPKARIETSPSAPMLWHDYANLFPLLEGDAFHALVEDIRANGVREPIVMFEGKVLDGRNRYLAARECGQSYPLIDYTGPDPLAYVISLNLKRRHLNEAQRATVASKLAKLPVGRPAETAQICAPSQEQAAEMLNVSRRSVQHAAAVLNHGAPELVESVEAGLIAVSAAAEVAKLPASVQAEIVAKGPTAVREAAREARKAKPPTKTAAQQAEPDTEAHSAPASNEDKERREIGRLTPEAMVDEIVGLRADLAEVKAEAKALKAERDDLKAKLKEALSSDMGRALGNAMRRADQNAGRMNEYMATNKRLEYRLKAAEKRVKELEETPIDMGAPTCRS